MRKAILFSILALFPTGAGLAQAQVPPLEREALIAFYNATDGSQWFDNTGWLGPVGSECDWIGVSCSGGHVDGLANASGWAKGTLPPELSDLAQLTYLILNTNEIGGSIPPELGDLEHLELLYLYQNRFTGQIPVELADLTSLTDLHLGENLLTGGIPPILATMVNLDRLALNENRLEGSIPPELATLPHLTDLYLGRNHLFGSIPPELGSLVTLERLWLGGNRFRGAVPIELGSLANLSMGNGIDLRTNALHTDDPALLAFLAPRQMGGVDWRDSQTLAPENLSVEWLGDHTVWLRWDTVTYTEPGGYEVSVAPAGGGPWLVAGRTDSKVILEMPVTGLEPGQSYDIAVASYTLPVEFNPNTVLSDPSYSESATTAESGCAEPVIEMTWADPVTLALTAGFDSYLWNTGETVPTIQVSPFETRYYWVTVTSSGPCQESAIVLVDQQMIFADGFELGDLSAW